ncbi:unnamed protein product [Ectocarpus sp. 12 AP-2014]
MVCAEWTALDCPHRPGIQADADGVCAGVRRYGHITPSVEQDAVGNVPDGEGFPCRPAQGSLRGTAEDRLSRPVCCLQLDLTSIGTDEFCTASVSVICRYLSNDKLPRHLNLATKVFRGQDTQTTIKTWIEQLTTDVFESIVPAVMPWDVYVAATIDQGLHVVNACKSLGIQTNPCLGHRIHSSVIGGIGVNGSATTQKNKKGRALVGKCAACAGMFSHCCTNSDAFRLLQETRNAKQREEMEQLRIDASAIEEAAKGEPPAGSGAATEGIPKALNIGRRNDTRWLSTERFLERLCVLEKPIANSSKTAKHWLTGVSHLPSGWRQRSSAAYWSR